MTFHAAFSVFAVAMSIMAGAPALAVTMFHETEANDTMATANFIGTHDGSINIFGFQKSDFDWYSFHGTAGDTLTLEVQDEGPNPNHPSTHEFDSVMALHNSLFELAWDDDDDTNINEFGDALPQRVRDKRGSFIAHRLAETGLYYVRLENFGINDTETYNYRLVVRGLTPSEPLSGTVPLPAGLPLMISALCAIGLMRRRQKV